MQRKTSAFRPEDIAAMQSAFTESCEALSFAIKTSTTVAEAGEIREEVAKQVLTIAHSGERQPAQITRKVLAAMPPLRANWKD